jgi:hypothetical protein
MSVTVAGGRCRSESQYRGDLGNVWQRGEDHGQSIGEFLFRDPGEIQWPRCTRRGWSFLLREADSY